MSDAATHINTSVLQVKPTQALPPDTSLPTTYFFCPTPNVKMHRTDGMTIDFRAGIHATNNKYTVDYLNQEIALGHPELRKATPEEIDSFNFHKDPAGYTRAKTIEEMEATINSRVLTLLNAKLREQGIASEVTADELAASVGAFADALETKSEPTSLEKLALQFKGASLGAVSTSDMLHKL